jgi:hypothetical protein
VHRVGAATLAAATLAVLAGGCSIASVTTIGADADITRAVLDQALVRDLQLGQIGAGPVTWAQRPGDLDPSGPMTVIDRLMEPTEGVVEVLHRDRDTDDVAEVALRPAWTTRLDNGSSSTPMRSAIDDEVTISYVQPGSPGQYGESDHAATIQIDVTVDVPSGECTDVAALQVWQLDDPKVSGNGATVDATYLGTEIVTMPCPA